MTEADGLAADDPAAMAQFLLESGRVGPGPHTRGCWPVDAILGKS